MNLQMFKLVLEKAEELEIKLPTSAGSSKKQESSRKISSLVLLTTPPLTVWITTNCGIFFKRWEYQTTLSVSWETCMQVKKQQFESDVEQWLVQNWERSMTKLYIVTLLIYLICRVPRAKCQAGWSTSWNQDCREKYQQPRIHRWYHFMEEI